MRKMRIVLIGPGSLGQSVTRLLQEAGHDIRAVIGRDRERTRMAARFIGSPESATTDLAAVERGDIVLLALPDDLLAPMGERLRREGHLTRDALLIHFSGIHPAAILLDERTPSVRALSIHPLQTFADAVIGLRSLPGTPCAVQGEESLLPLGEQLVRDFGGIPFRLDGKQKPLYHAAACVASNYMVTLVSVAGEIMAACGFDEKEAFHLLTPLLRGTGKNLAALGPEKALTGPIARGDVRTVALHLKALQGLSAELQEIYRVMGRKTVAVARAKGTLAEEEAQELVRLLDSESA